MIFKNIIFITFFILLIKFSVFSQEKEFNFERVKTYNISKKRVFTGMQYYKEKGYQSFVFLPEINVRLNKKLFIGTGFNTSFYYDFNRSHTHFILGSRIFVRYFAWNQTFIQTEMEILNLSAYDQNTGRNENKIFIPRFHTGIGYRVKFAKRVFLVNSLLYGVSIIDDKPINSIAYRMGFVF